MVENIWSIQESLGLVSCHWCPQELPLTVLLCCPAALGGSQGEGHQEGRVGRVSQEWNGGAHPNPPGAPYTLCQALCSPRGGGSMACCRIYSWAAKQEEEEAKVCQWSGTAAPSTSRHCVPQGLCSCSLHIPPGGTAWHRQSQGSSSVLSVFFRKGHGCSQGDPELQDALGLY